MNKEVKMNVYRFDPNKDKEGKFQEFTVPVEEGMVVLDAVFFSHFLSFLG